MIYASSLSPSKNAGVVVRGMIDQEPSELGTLQSAGVDAIASGTFNGRRIFFITNIVLSIHSYDPQAIRW